VSPTHRQATVLIVEDNRDNLTIYRTILEHFGYAVLEALDGEAGVNMTREHLPDLVLMDISIPIIDGLLATRILKADPATASIPIVALTAHALADDRARAAEAGCDAYIAKPAEPRHVAAEVARLVSEARSRIF
jgi:CheY-like chemotaxis protein